MSIYTTTKKEEKDFKGLTFDKFKEEIKKLQTLSRTDKNIRNIGKASIFISTMDEDGE